MTMLRYSQAPAGAKRAVPAPHARPAAVLVVLCTAAFMAMLDVFVVNVALPGISRAYRAAPLADVGWVLNGYTIVYAALLIPVGRFADRYGRKSGFMAGLALFTIASIGCATAPGLWWLVAFRTLEAIGAAALTPTSLALILTTLPAERRAAGVKAWATTSSVAAAVGPVLGGALIRASWHWIFLINLPIGIVALIAAAWLVPDSRDASTRIPDPLGALLLAIAVGGLSLAVVKANDWGWGGRATLTALAVFVVGTLAFIIRISRHPAPVVDPSLLRVRSFVWANLTVLLFCTAFAAMLTSVVLDLEDQVGLTALATGLAIAPGPLLVALFAPLGQRFGRRLSPRALIGIGNTVFALGLVILAASTTWHADWVSAVLPGWLVTGVGIGLALPTMLSSATASLPPAQAATGSAVVNTSRQLGYVAGVCLVVAILTAPAAARQPIPAFAHAWSVLAVLAAVSALTALGITRARARHESHE